VSRGGIADMIATSNFRLCATLILRTMVVWGAAHAQQRIPIGPSALLFYDDLSSTALRSFPAKLRRIAGNMAVVEDRGQRFLQVSTSGTFEIPLGSPLPETYTIEFDMLVPSSTGYSVEVRPDAPGSVAGYADLRRRVQNPVVHCGAISAGVYGSSSEVSELTRFPDSLAKQLTRCKIEVTPGGVKVYFGQELAADAAGSSLGAGSVIRWHVPTGPRAAALIGPIRVTSASQRLAAQPPSAGVPRHGELTGQPKPQGVTTTQQGSTSVIIGWNCVEAARGYEVYASIAGAARSKIGDASNVCNQPSPGMQGYDKPAALDPNAPSQTPRRKSLLHENVPGEASVTYAVRALFDDGFTESEPVSHTLRTALAPPAKLTAQMQGLQLVMLSWEAVPGAQGYRVQRTFPNSSSDRKQLTPEACHTETTITELQTVPGSYTYFVSACPSGAAASAGITVPPFPRPVAVKHGPSSNHPGYAIFDQSCTPCHASGLTQIDVGWCWWDGCDPVTWTHQDFMALNSLVNEREQLRTTGTYEPGKWRKFPVEDDVKGWTDWMRRSVSSLTKVMGRPLLCCRPPDVRFGSAGPERRLLTRAEIDAVISYVLDEQVVKHTVHDISTPAPELPAYTQNCARCHGSSSFSGKGLEHGHVRNIILNGRTGPTPRPFGMPTECRDLQYRNEPDWTEFDWAAEADRVCLHGRRHMGPQVITRMPSFKDRFTEAELVDLTEYVVRLSR
jgi:hypothetical protein